MRSQRRPARVSYVEDPAIDRALATSAPENGPKILRDLVREVGRARRSQLALGILVLRIKADPDTAQKAWGGRPPLATLLLRVSQTLRETDTVGQLSKDELLAILPGADMEGGCVVSERLQNNARTHRDRGLMTFAFACGVDVLAPDDDNVMALVDRARSVARASLD